MACGCKMSDLTQAHGIAMTTSLLFLENNAAQKILKTIMIIHLKDEVYRRRHILERFEAPAEFFVRVDVRVVEKTGYLMIKQT